MASSRHFGVFCNKPQLHPTETDSTVSHLLHPQSSSKYFQNLLASQPWPRDRFWEKKSTFCSLWCHYCLCDFEQVSKPLWSSFHICGIGLVVFTLQSLWLNEIIYAECSIWGHRKIFNTYQVLYNFLNRIYFLQWFSVCSKSKRRYRFPKDPRSRMCAAPLLSNSATRVTHLLQSTAYIDTLSPDYHPKVLMFLNTGTLSQAVLAHRNQKGFSIAKTGMPSSNTQRATGCHVQKGQCTKGPGAREEHLHVPRT